MPSIIPGDVSMCDALAPRLRAADAAELEASGLAPLAGLRAACAVSSTVHAIADDDGTPLALFGFAPGDALGRPDTGLPWLLGSDALVTTHRRWFLRNTPRVVQAGDHRWRQFFGKVDARNTVHVRWLRWAGFMVLPAVPWGPFRLPFHPFYRKVQAHV